MENLRPFQIGLLAAFAIVALISIVLIASYQGVARSGANNPYGQSVTIWGTLDQRAFTDVLNELSQTDRNIISVKYIQKDARTFESELVNAIAEGRSPDAILLNHEDLVTLRSKLLSIPYTTFSERTLRDNYLDGFEVFARADGLYAVPFAVDPLLMYWNRDILAASGFSLPPTTWESLTSMVEQVTLRDATRNISQATVAFGEYQNVFNAKSILLTLMLQSGSRMVVEEQSRYSVSLDTSSSGSNRPLTSTLQFFVEFSNPSSPLYSWNRNFQNDQSAFLGERLALYFGYGSEASRLRSQNPNLNFDVTSIPQGAAATTKRVYGKFYGFALLQASGNRQGAYQAITKLASSDVGSKIAGSLALVPANRNTIASGSGDSVMQTAFNQALIARGWLDPNPAKSSEVFGQAIDDILSGRSQVGNAGTDAVRRLQLAF